LAVTGRPPAPFSRERKGGSPVSILWIILIVIVVLALLGFVGRGL
jgi:flagellar basal body-associated protein FliL